MTTQLSVRSPGQGAATRAMWSALDAAATPVFTLATLGALVRALSPTNYGILVIVLAASSLSMAVNPAIAATTTKFVSELSGHENHIGRSIAGVITVSLTMVAVIDILLLLAALIFNNSLSEWLFGAEITGASHVGRMLPLAVLAVGFQQIEAVFSAALKGLERFKRQAIIEVSSRSLLTAVVIYVAWQTRSIEAILEAQCSVYLLSLLFRAIALHRILPHNRLFERSTKKEAGNLLRYSGWMWLAALAGVAYTTADRIMIGRGLGAAEAGRYNIYIQIAQVIHFIPSSAFAFSLPVFSRLAAQGEASRATITSSYKTYLLVVCFGSTVLGALIMLSWPMVLGVFAGSGSADQQLAVPRTLTVNFMLLACNVAPYYLMIAMGGARAVSIITTLSMFTALTLMVVLIPRYGMEGAAIARLAYGVGALMLLRKAHRLLKQDWQVA
jgi:O-antigen/teichoic acid export membrane protein